MTTTGDDEDDLVEGCVQFQQHALEGQLHTDDNRKIASEAP